MIDGKGGAVLIVEDDPGVSTLERRRLERAGYAAFTAATAEEALRLLGRERVELVLLDYRLPGEIDGLGFYARMREAGRDLPVILVTGFSDEATVIRALRAGVRDFVTKSSEYLDYLPEAVERVLRQVRTERSLAESEARFSAIVEAAKDAIILAEADQRVSLFNKAAEAMFRCPAAEAVGQPVSRFIPREYHVDAGPDAGGPEGPIESLTHHVRFGTRGVRAGGEEFPLEASVSRVTVLGRKVYTIVVRDVTERKRAEQSLRESEERFRLLVDGVKDYAIFMLDPQGRVATWNAGAERLKGYRAEEIIGQHFSCFYPREAIDRGWPAEELRLAAAGRLEDEGWRVRKDGSRFRANVVINPLRDQAGQLRGFAKVTRDITEQKEAEARLIERDRRLMEAQRIARLGTWEWDCATGELRWSEEIYRAMGMSPEDRPLNVGEAFQSIPPDERESVRRVVEEARRLRKPFSVAHRVVRSDGSVGFLQARGEVVTTGDEAVRFAGITQDVTEAREAEEARHRYEMQFRQVWEKSLDGMRLTDEEGVICLVNDAYCRMVGKPREELVGQPFPSVYAAQERQEVFDAYRGHFASHTVQPHATTGLSNERTLWNGKKFYLETSYTFLNVAGQPGRMLSVVRDVTEQRRLEEQFRQSQKMDAFGQLAGGVAHDFNNLLTVIQGFTEVVVSRLPASNPDRGLLQEVYKAGERAALLTKQLLVFSRKGVVEARVLDLNEVVRDTEKMLARLIGEDVELATALVGDLSRVKADPGHIQQVVMNLAVNARDAMPRGGKLTIETANVELGDDYSQSHPEVKPGRYVLLAVSDTGCGMTDEVKARIFEPFFTTKGVGKGTGLGLATVYGIVKQAGGHVNVYSEPGRGTTFKVYLPPVEDPVSSAQPLRPPETSPRGSETVLLVEDEDAVRRMARIALQMNGYTVLEAAGGQEALRVAEEYLGPIHLLITDVVMPGLSGQQVAERLLVWKPGIRVLFQSGYTDDAVVRHGVLHAEVAFLQKPYTPSVLASKVREVLDQGDEGRP